MVLIALGKKFEDRIHLTDGKARAAKGKTLDCGNAEAESESERDIPEKNRILEVSSRLRKDRTEPDFVYCLLSSTVERALSSVVPITT